MLKSQDVGIYRLFFMVLNDAYIEDKERLYLKLNPSIAPYKVAVFPLLANKEELIKKAREIFVNLKSQFNTYWDARGNIGKRYMYQDEIGTPFCVTIDFDTLKDHTVTIRDRDSTKQERVSIDKLVEYLKNELM